MVKLMENTYRDVNVAIANEFSRLADRFGIDIWEAIAIANHHPRVKILNPGPGVGGHCISVDPWFLVEAAEDITPLIHMARIVNDAQPEFVVDLAKRAAGEELSGKRIAALGLSYKADVDDLRESPAIEVARLLVEAGCQVKAFEPCKPAAVIEGLTSVPSLEDALAGADILVLLVGHKVFRGLDPQAVAQMTPARIVIDTINGWIGKDWEAVGFKVYRLGVGRDSAT